MLILAAAQLFSNQLPVGKGRVTAADMQRKFDAIVARLGVPVEVFIATEENEFRKPRPGMVRGACMACRARVGATMVTMMPLARRQWDMFVGKFNGGVRPDPAQSFFVGDAAGRPKDGPRKKDFSASAPPPLSSPAPLTAACAGDYKFASNIGLPFHTPEAFFLGAKSRLHTEPALWQVGSTVSDLRAAAGQPLFRPPHASLPAEADAPEILLLVGPPASGKSTFCKAHLPNYERVNQDTLKTVAKCRQAAAEAVRAGKRVVVDSTNRDRAARAGWVELARELTVPVRCYYFDLPKELPAHLNEFRGLVPSEDRRRLSSIVFRVFQGKHEPPGAEEGLAEVRRVNFVPLTFEDEATERLFYSFLV